MSDDWINEWNRPNAGDLRPSLFTEGEASPWTHLCLECDCFWQGDDKACPACGWAPAPASNGSFIVTGTSKGPSLEIISVEKDNLTAPAFGGRDPLLGMMKSALTRGEDPGEAVKGATMWVRMKKDDEADS